MGKYICVKNCHGEEYEYFVNDIVYLKKVDGGTAFISDGHDDNIQTWVFGIAFKEVSAELLKWEDVKQGDLLKQVNEEKVCCKLSNLDMTYLEYNYHVSNKGTDYLTFDGVFIVHKDSIHNFVKVGK